MTVNENCEGCPYKDTVYCSLIAECPAKKDGEQYAKR